MFNWFRTHSQCPVKDHVKRWVDWRMDWLIRQFGRERLTDLETILPIANHFPANYDASREAVRALFDQVCAYLDIDGEKLELSYYSQGQGQGRHFGSAGIYDEREDGTIVWLEKSNVNDPMSVVATFAHELCHYLLLGGKRLGRNEPDHEPLTDLAVIFFGFGIFVANASFRSSSYSSGSWHYTSMKRQGYLPPPVLGYGLALYALLREEMKPAWARYVRPDVREPMRKALAYMHSSGAVELGRDVDPPLDPPELSQDLLERLGLPPADRNEGDAAGPAETEDHRANTHSSPDDAFTEATVALNARRYEEAAILFQKVIDDQPDDGEAYGQLALAQLQLNLPAEAISPASKAIEISPDDAEALQIRGSAYFELGRYQAAVDDLARSLAFDRDAKRPGRLAETAHLLGKARARLGEHRQAIRDFSFAISELPTWAAPYESRAEVYERLGETEKAAADRDKAARRRQAL
jgi:tetratricopeptide (TPR) repeat protein